MTDPHDEYGEILRRALNAEAEKVTPAADGLEQIRRRIEERRRRRFSWDWFTANWARPLLAVAAAVAIAGLGVSAPQTLGFLSSTAGGNGSSDGQEHSSLDGTVSGAPGAQPGTRLPDSYGSAPGDAPSASATVTPSTASGSPGCADGDSTTDRASAGSPAPQASGPCTTPPTTPTPPTQQPPDTPTTPSSEPSEQPEAPTSSEPAPASTDAPAVAPE
ncbi:hypothetical protein Acsp04_12810 [Actinomadura sp. NBRC 104425]|uniref:hypothetical protein n=1 Tax=Actinomadura sp. NBRC 104425 TaxID=3032204 RepID=UPI0024A5A1F4|nr:hypothetical protein [Actinomadura sp. NBRC 104425]GLZ11046.1 hypothetical protein Acsp04_12810 [Actinomadura sp. NBRC 104425]